nr:Chain C, apidaecin peptide fragment [Apis mellifera]4E81_D Chain D, apidaecin peptide fragment [Apis mellifera]
NRPVYIPRPP